MTHVKELNSELLTFIRLLACVKDQGWHLSGNIRNECNDCPYVALRKTIIVPIMKPLNMRAIFGAADEWEGHDPQLRRLMQEALR